MKYIFGPVYSRRFGISLGIDLSPDTKRCNFDCLYCELEKSKPTDVYSNASEPESILKELKSFLKNNKEINVITITANGEPTLYPYLDELIEKINRIKGEIKTLILSNASTIHKPEIRETLKKFDIVKLSLDTVDESIFKKVDRPLKGISIKEIIDGIKKFRREFNKKLIIEILVVKYVNDSPDEIRKIGEVLKEIKPDRVDLGTVDRPPAYRVFPVSNEKLHYLSSFLEGLNVNVVERKHEKSYQFELSEEEILNTLSKRPLTEEDIEKTFSSETVKIFKQLLEENKIKEETINGKKFFVYQE